jgi:hypothetical protein
LYEDLVSNGYDQVKLIGVGKSQHMNWLSNWTDGNDASVCADQSGFAGYAAWNEWEASQRDLFILNHEGTLVFHENVTGGLPSDLESLVIDLVSQIPGDSECTDGDINNDNPCNPMECWDGQWIEIIIDCPEGMGIPCEGGIYIPPAEGDCCSICISLGDISGDGIINVLDVVAMVNLVLSGGYDEIADMNGDGTLNVLDVVLLVGIILG